ncbi:pro-cathepsin H-like isoform X1 [Pempheris klunzingeri]|uniref:pro-cathepsin H-like isoform X1 n=1 Tax=Pempheris klunzingeri TaxID=3127111 RepID=UPI00397F02BC
MDSSSNTGNETTRREKLDENTNSDSLGPSAQQPETTSDESLFKSWMAKHDKTYSTNEYYQRLQIFIENKRKIDQHNAGNHSFTMGLNQFSDMTYEEFEKIYLCKRTPEQT